MSYRDLFSLDSTLRITCYEDGVIAEQIFENKERRIQFLTFEEACILLSDKAAKHKANEQQQQKQKSNEQQQQRQQQNQYNLRSKGNPAKFF